MDPNANLEQQLNCARAIQRLDDSIADPSTLESHELRRYDEQRADIEEQIRDEAIGLAELVLALDEWRRGGGFDPYVEPLKVWLLSIDTKYGTDTTLHATQEAAQRVLVAWVRENWPESGPPDPPDDQDAIATYFRYRDTTDSYIIDEQEVSR